MIAMLAVPAYAQSQNSKDPPKSPQEIEAERAAEQAYKKSLSNKCGSTSAYEFFDADLQQSLTNVRS
jgi:hypothetical protein